MRIAVIDIGSNTIKMTIFNKTETTLTAIMNKTENTGLISYIENGVLSEKGIRVLCDTVAGLASEAGRNSCFYIYPFATASLRKTANYEQILERVEKKTGHAITLLSGAEEASFSFDGLVKSLGKDLEKTGLTFDMGGGSTEIVSFKNKELTGSVSLDIGVLALYNTYVKNILPTKGEAKKIKKYTKKLYTNVPFLRNGEKVKNIYMVGGTGKAISKLHASLSNRPINFPYDIKKADLIDLVTKLINKKDHMTMISAIREIPSRIHTVCPGLIAITTLMEVAGADILTVTQASIREGYAMHVAKMSKE